MIPNSIQNALLLKYFHFSNNILTGSIPSEIGLLPLLQIFYIDRNHFSGSIPISINLLSNLYWFYATFNQLTSTIPNNMNGMTSLYEFDVSYNRLTGHMPQLMSEMTNIVSVLLFNNSLSGVIPDYLFTHMSSLRVLMIQNNKFTGRLLSNYDTVSTINNTSFTTHLTNIDVGTNRLTGPLPLHLFANNSALKTVSFSKNCFSTPLSEVICEAVNLNVIAMDGLGTECNQVGVISDIPQCLFAMPALHTLHLSGNQIEG
jgi:Leucine-rich repeat (LRR) protein